MPATASISSRAPRGWSVWTSRLTTSPETSRSCPRRTTAETAATWIVMRPVPGPIPAGRWCHKRLNRQRTLRASSVPKTGSCVMHVRCKWLRAGLRFAVGGAVMMFAIGAAASPFLPTDDAQVLERLPGGNTPQFRQLRSLRSAAALAPNDIARATILATAYIRASRLEGDPRFIGYAQAALTPWWKDTEAPIAVLMLRATILQSRHEFAAALTDLDNLLLRDPANPQALLTRATVLTVRGRYAQARGDCNRLYGIAAEIYPVACSAAIDSVTGDARGAYERLQRAVQGWARVDAGGRAWAETLLGEIAQRRGDPVAERHFRAALAGERDLYPLGAYSDWLLDQGRAAD